MHALHLLLLCSRHQQPLLYKRLQLHLLPRPHQLCALRQVVVQFLLLQAAAAQFHLHLVALVALVTRVQGVLLLRDQSALQQVVPVVAQVLALVACRVQRLVVALLALVALCVLRRGAVLDLLVQVLV